jgi:hypothetical protein
VLRTLEHPLTFGVGAVGLQCGGYAIGGTALFDYNVATLWGPALNVLTLLDANVLDDRFVGDLDGAQFRRNVIAWVANEPVSTVPEPTALALVAVGAAAVGVAARRRGARQA